jgi:hypothetical protein
VRRPFEWLGEHLSTRIVMIRIAEAFQEIALLWFVFANLDLLVSDRFTWAWSLKNSLMCFLVWALGVLFESILHKKGVGR